MDDVAAAITTAALSPWCEPMRVFNLGSGQAIPLRTLVEDVVAQLGIHVRLKFGERPYARFEPMHLVADTARVRQSLGWEARTSLAYAVWELARASFPNLAVNKPDRSCRVPINGRVNYVATFQAGRSYLMEDLHAERKLPRMFDAPELLIALILSWR